MVKTLKPEKTYRVYGVPHKIGVDYYEVGYKEYRGMTEIRCGTEDFSLKRWISTINHYRIKVYNGRFNKAGERMTDTANRRLNISKGAKGYAIKHARMMYDNVARVII